MRKAQPKQRRERRREHGVDGNTVRMAMPRSLRNNPDYTYRWFNDEGSRLSGAVANDYDFANEAGEEVARNAKSRHKVHVGTMPSGQPLYSYLMRKHKDWFNSDKVEAQTAIDENMKSIKSDAENPTDPTRYKSGAVSDIQVG